MKFVVAMCSCHKVLLCLLPCQFSFPPCRDIFHVHFRAENFEPYLSQVLKIRWEDELGKRNPLADKEYRYFGQLFLCVGRLS